VRPPRNVRFEPVLPRLARNTVIEPTFEVGRRFRCTMRIDCSGLDPDAVIRPEPYEWHPHMPAQLDEEELANWRRGPRNAVYQLAAPPTGRVSRSPTPRAWNCERKTPAEKCQLELVGLSPGLSPQTAHLPL
jgi:hypothetical protein